MELVDNQKLYSALKELNIIPQIKLDEAFTQSQDKNLNLSETLLNKDLISDENLGKLIADMLHFPFVNLNNISIPLDILNIIPEIVAKKHLIIAYAADKQGLHLAMANPKDTLMRIFIEKKAGIPIVVHYASRRNILDALSLYAQDITVALKNILGDQNKPKGKNIIEPSIIKIVDTLITYASRNKASDIHIEPEKNMTVVRFRIDGILHDIANLPREIHPQIVIRVKILANLRTDEHQSAQDGKISYVVDNEDVDIRVSIVPITFGEKIVMRLLAPETRQYALSDLGITGNDLSKIENAFNKPHGMLLSTGPTGSGKTTTMYAVLKLLNKRAINIMTIEDPVEYEILGINQIQVNNKTNLTFAAGLRSIVRQDPDVILVGEIRDEETAGIAVNSAMTGHLVLSTLHTNDAATALPRLIDMKVEPYLIASTVNVIIGQRLVRRICQKCRISSEISKTELAKHFSVKIISKYFKSKQKSTRNYFGKGCSVCHHTGYVGRIGIFEVMEIDNDIRKAITDKRDASIIEAIAVKNGMRTMLEDGLDKVFNGVTTIEEILRVTKQ